SFDRVTELLHHRPDKQRRRGNFVFHRRRKQHTFRLNTSDRHVPTTSGKQTIRVLTQRQPRREASSIFGILGNDQGASIVMTAVAARPHGRAQLAMSTTSRCSSDATTA